MEKIIERVNKIVLLINHRISTINSIQELIEFKSSKTYKRQMNTLKDLIWCLEQLGINYEIEYKENGNVVVKEVA